jgi:hypothetical protein
LITIQPFYARIMSFTALYGGPQLTIRVCSVIALDSSEAKNTVAAAISASSAGLWRERMRDKTKSILFVYVHNSGRNQMAETFFNHMAKGKAQAYSAGTQPADQINPVVIEAIREVGIDISGNKPKPLTMEMV